MQKANSPIRKSGRYALPTKSKIFCRLRRKSPNDLSMSPASAGMAFIWLQRGHHLLLFPLPLPIPKRGFQRRGLSPSPKKGFQRGGPQPAPLCRFKGVRGEIEIPPRFSLGGRGDILFSKENIPLTSPYRNGTVPPGTPVIFSARRKENGDSI